MSNPTKLTNAATMLARRRNELLGEDGLQRMGRKTARALKEKYGPDVYRRIRLGLPLEPRNSEEGK